MIKILMVCLGNICRSPLAEGILKSKVDANKFYIDSAGTGGWHIGELPDGRSISVARTHGIDLTDQRCRKFSILDFDDFDIIYVMDKSNYRDVISLARLEKDKKKVRLILDELNALESNEVPDPYYGGDMGFENVFQMLNKTCDIIASKLN
ncbi:MAG: low molecular weight phosphotyrosine protein phosphatase [Flavobacteriaceae bacterium]|nr:low molecular weight phosphotyrosine protein phosphatase [Flavobacteriaceae bacterium]